MACRPYPGWFVVFEGGDGVGKSTQVRLLARTLTQAGVDHVLTCEPGGSALGGALRALLLDPSGYSVAPRAEALMYAADKAQHLHEVVLPALRRGAVVICDRYLDSMIAYQGAGRTLELSEVRRLGKWATGGLRPDLTVLLDMDPDRAVGQKSGKDRLELAGADFHRRARQGFLDLAAEHPEAYLVLKARTSRSGIAGVIRRRLAQMGVPGTGHPEMSEDAGTLNDSG
ncbi:dTMP kinase [Propionibacterium sp.]|uniref:dTMP kinase n=1 Tax=Propionibacterium sp. TaxID=1977903 RepID=UPI0039EB5F7E